MRKNYISAHKGKDARAGILFVLPWTIGLIFFFIRPLVSAVLYSFGNPSIELNGIKINFIGLKNYIDAFTNDAKFPRMLVENIGGLIVDVLIIICFSLFIGIILNTEFKGRTFARALFFMPVIVTSGLVLDVLYSNPVSQALLSGGSSATINTESFEEVFIAMGLPISIVSFIGGIISNIFNLTWESGVQILLFLAGLQGVPSHLYEASKVEGATGWDRFWKITFPLLMPTVLLNIVYTLISKFTDSNNEIMVYIIEFAHSLKYGYSSALAIIYFIIILVLAGATYFIVNKFSAVNR